MFGTRYSNVNVKSGKYLVFHNSLICFSLQCLEPDILVNVKTGKHLVFHNSAICCWGLWRCCKVKSKEETAEVVGSQGFHPKTLLRTTIFLFENFDTALPS